VKARWIVISIAALGVRCGSDDPEPIISDVTPIEGAPSGYQFGAMVFDTGRGRAVMFGGAQARRPDAPTELTVYGSTWEWDGEAWRQVADSGPSPRIDHAMAYDPYRDRTVLFGGFGPCASASFDCCADTWEWNGTSWRSIAVDGPAAIRGASAVYDPLTQTITLFGGVHCDASASPSREVWRYDGAAWARTWP
jgi:hypothetical protein